MKKNKNQFLKLNLSFSMYCIIGIIILFNIENSKHTIYYKEYIVLSISYFLVAAISFWSIISKKIDIFQPYILISILYLCIFIFTPMIFIINGKTDAHGTDVMGGCIKATVIFVFSYIAFTIGYIKYKVKLINPKFTTKFIMTEYIRKKTVIISCYIWIISYLLTILHLISSGKNIIQILTIGGIGATNTYGSNSLLGFVSNFSFCMIIPWMYICFLSKNKLLKIIITYLTATAYIIRGFRYIIIIMIVAFAITYYRKRNKKPGVLIIILGVISLLVFIGALGYMRNNLRTGVGTEWNSFGIDKILYALESNFDIYKTFYAIVEHYPAEYSYTFGKSMFFETIIMFVPRMFWPNKPLAIDASVVLAIRRSVSEFAITNAAMATPNIGEFYVDFGIIGCIIFMFILGVVAKWTTKYYFAPNNNIKYIILYSVIMPTFLQLIIRGYTPSNFYLVIFLLMPYKIINILVANKFVIS